MTLNNLEMMVLATANKLISKNGSTTTLDIKNQCRIDYPNEKIYQSDVNQIMIDKHDMLDGVFYTDNGTHRVYTRNINQVVAPTPVAGTQTTTTSITKLSKKDIVKLLKENTGKFLSVTFIKKSGEERKINAHQSAQSFMNSLGYLQFKTNTNEFKQVDPKKILCVKINNQTYVSK